MRRFKNVDQLWTNILLFNQTKILNSLSNILKMTFAENIQILEKFNPRISSLRILNSLFIYS